MKNYVGIMNIDTLNEAVVATNGFWRHFNRFPCTRKPLIGLNIGPTTKDSEELGRIDKLTMMLSAVADIADVAISYGNCLTTDLNSVEDLKAVASIPKTGRRIKAFYLKNPQNASVVEELKNTFPQIATIFTMDGNSLDTVDKVEENVALYGKNLDEILVGVTEEGRETCESLHLAYKAYSAIKRMNPKQAVGFFGNFRYVNDGLIEVLEFARREDCRVYLEKPLVKDKKYSFEQHTREFVREVASAFSVTKTI